MTQIITEKREHVVTWDENELVRKGVRVEWYFCIAAGKYRESLPMTIRLRYKEKTMICQVYLPPFHQEEYTEKELLYYVMERYRKSIDSCKYYTDYLIERYGKRAFDYQVVRSHQAFCHRLETFFGEE